MSSPAQRPLRRTITSPTPQAAPGPDAERAPSGDDLGGVDPQERIDSLLAHLGTRSTGLSAREAARRLTQFGPNVISRTAKQGRIRELVRQLVHPLALLLWVAAVLAAASGSQTLAIAIVAVILLNAALAYAQELQAERATEALRELLPARARVRRDGAELDVAAIELVPGDVVLLSEGDRLSADARLTAGSLELDMAPLTGESEPVVRSASAVHRVASVLESEDLVFAGTLCTGGDAEAVIYATGMGTQLGRIAALSQRVKPEISPLQRQVNRVAWLIAAIAVAAGALFFVAGTTLAGLSLAAAVTFAIGLLVANVPEGLLPTITLSLAGGVRRMAARHALVKRLTAVETLGSTDVICTDKTGTLTEGRMSVRLLWCAGTELELASAAGSPAPDLFSPLLRTAVRCNNGRLERDGERWVRGGDPSESALLLAAAQLGVDVQAAEREREGRRKRVFHFDPHLKRMTTLDDEPGGQLWYHAKGAPLELLERCTAIRTPDGDHSLTDADRTEVRAAFESYAAKGLRVLGFAQRQVAQADDGPREAVESNLTFVGLAALEDPPRPEVTDAVARCKRAGIRIVVVTGDHGLTATAIAREVGLVSGESEPTVISGADLDAMAQDERDQLLSTAPELIVARSNPETKLHIVDALRAQGHTVAMTGDGVNDAPALRRADIGVAMGASGTDVAREAATMVLTDDNFASIVAAVEEGRVVYDNIRKFITYIFVHAVPEVFPFLIYALAGGAIPLPLTAIQILAIDLGTDTVPALALGREPAEPGTMDRPPRPREAGIISRAMLARAWLRLGVLEALLVTGGFFLVMLTAGWSVGEHIGSGTPLHHAYQQATTMTWAGIVACQIGAAFAVRTSHASLREVGVLSNRHLLRGIAFALAFAAAIIYAPPIQAIFKTSPLSVRDLLVLACFPIIVWGSDELWRWHTRSRAAASAPTTDRDIYTTTGHSPEASIGMPGRMS
ncbi:cation-transporting P-type ATPase [Conexibacter sp. S30A1]|uniref:cation-translocating P-type ATPase n=1 Tax=Conexibacter sp. S30A1 TaxID=2937800 RepID=UPI0020101686|nr:cation-transporting P-type ATPase [Conexibacter sp. S30A1]